MTHGEMEALLKLDSAVLVVTKNPKEYSAIITRKGRHFARISVDRATAVQQAWELYQRFMRPPPKPRGAPEWVKEEVHGEIEVNYNQLMKEKQNECSK